MKPQNKILDGKGGGREFGLHLWFKLQLTECLKLILLYVLVFFALFPIYIKVSVRIMESCLQYFICRHHARKYIAKSNTVECACEEYQEWRGLAFI